MTIADYKHKLANLTRDQQELLGDFALLVVGGRGQDFMHKIKNCINTNTRPSSSPQPQSSNKPQQKASGTPQPKKSVTNSPNVSPKPPTVSPNSPKVSPKSSTVSPNSPKVSPKPSQTQPDKPNKSSNESKSSTVSPNSPKVSPKPSQTQPDKPNKSSNESRSDRLKQKKKLFEEFMFYCDATGNNFEDGTSRRKAMEKAWNYIKTQPKLLNEWHMPAECTEEQREANKKKWEDKKKKRNRERRRTKTMEKARKGERESPIDIDE